MGWEIVREKHPDVRGKWSRLWLFKDVHHVLTDNTGTDKVKGIMLNKPKERVIRLNGKSFSSMSNLMLLKLSNVDVSEGQIYLPNNLRFLKWHGFPLKTLPSNFPTRNLFELNLCGSQLNYLWKGMKDFPKLKTVKLSNSHNLIETPDFTMVPNLEMLDVKGCTKLRKVHKSVEVLKSLSVLNLEGCKNLQSFQVFFVMKSLKILNLRGCSKLDKFPENLEELELLEELDVGGTAISQVPSSIARLTNLQKLSFQKCNSQPWWSSYLLRTNTRCLALPSLTELPSNILCVWADGCHSLEDVSLRGCTSPEIALYLFNCPKLIQNRGHQEINLAVMLLKHYIQGVMMAVEKQQLWWNLFEIYIPGNEIPEWFSCRSDEDSVKIGLPSNWLNDEFMGIAMCGVFTPDHKDLDGRKYVICCMDIMGNRYLYSGGRHRFTTFESNHLWLNYVPREAFETTRSQTLESARLLPRLEPWEYDSTNSVLVSTSTCIHAYFEVTDGKRLSTKAVKSSGIRLVYKGDIECSEDDILLSTDASILYQHNNCSTFAGQISVTHVWYYKPHMIEYEIRRLEYGSKSRYNDDYRRFLYKLRRSWDQMR
ncbi:hypothetical protein LWI29_032789 [Acer saccharum]|uniref:Uncharacterized protein n=1 Tax=Acer saccharum TaxID=4024 RepID=A0AA39VPB9_ACESA|nr:hypothetical protein LWI29_032789 [Acer saccharum]